MLQAIRVGNIVVKFWTVPRIWPDSTVYILGGGPGLSKVSLSLIRDKRIIGVNNAYQFGDWVDVCWFGDASWYKKHITGLVNFAGLRVHSCNSYAERPGTHRLARGKPYGIETRREYISWNNNSGASAINLAYHFGVKKIVLIGFDMRTIDGKNNWHDDHGSRPKDWNPYPRFMQGWKRIAQDARQLGLEILNATPDSALTVFPIVKLEDVC